MHALMINEIGAAIPEYQPCTHVYNKKSVFIAVVYNVGLGGINHDWGEPEQAPHRR